MAELTPEERMTIYVASRASRPHLPAMWKKLREDGWPVISSWIDEAGPGETASFGELWTRIQGEIERCGALLLYADAEDLPLKGAYVEAGMALALNKPVIVVATCEIGSWVAHPGVIRLQAIPTVAELIDVIDRLTAPVTGTNIAGAGNAAPPASAGDSQPGDAPPFNLVSHLKRQRDFSQRTFGPGPRTAGVLDHIRKELREIEESPRGISSGSVTMYISDAPPEPDWADATEAQILLAQPKCATCGDTGHAIDRYRGGVPCPYCRGGYDRR